MAANQALRPGTDPSQAHIPVPFQQLGGPAHTTPLVIGFLPSNAGRASATLQGLCGLKEKRYVKKRAQQHAPSAPGLAGRSRRNGPGSGPAITDGTSRRRRRVSRPPRRTACEATGGGAPAPHEREHPAENRGAAVPWRLDPRGRRARHEPERARLPARGPSAPRPVTCSASASHSQSCRHVRNLYLSLNTKHISGLA